MKDFLGQEIRVGDTIVYPTRQSSSMWVNKAEVIELLAHKLKVRRHDGKIKTLERIDRVVVLTGELRND